MLNPIKIIEMIANEIGGQVHFDQHADLDDLLDCGPGGGGARAAGAAGGTVLVGI